MKRLKLAITSLLLMLAWGMCAQEVVLNEGSELSIYGPRSEVPSVRYTDSTLVVSCDSVEAMTVVVTASNGDQVINQYIIASPAELAIPLPNNFDPCGATVELYCEERKYEGEF